MTFEINPPFLLKFFQAESFRMHTEEATNDDMTEEDIGIDVRDNAN